MAIKDTNNNTQQIEEVKELLRTLDTQLRQVSETLQSEALQDVLNNSLHNTEKLPDAELMTAAKDVVDSMDSLQLQLVPSVMLLADGFFGYLHSKSMATLVSYKVPDILKEHGPLPCSEIGPLVGAQHERIAQLMDMVVNNGIFTYDDASGKYSNNRCSLLLCRDHWTQWYLWADLYPNQFFNMSRSIPAAIAEGEKKNAAQIDYGTDLSIFEYLAQQGEIGIFHRTLGAGAKAMAGGIAVDYPWKELGDAEIVDLGGGSGDFLAEVLRANPSLRGSLVDLQHVIDLVTKSVREPEGSLVDVSPRIVNLYVGDFFGDILPASVYTMKWCLHNWMDDDVVRILSNARAKLVPSPLSRFIVFESVKKPGRSTRLPRYGDLVMMMTCNGKERSLQDWERLAQLSGWRLNRVLPIRNAWVSAIEMLPQ